MAVHIRPFLQRSAVNSYRIPHIIQYINWITFGRNIHTDTMIHSNGKYLWIQYVNDWIIDMIGIDSMRASIQV